MKKSNFFKISKNLFIESQNHIPPSPELVSEIEVLAIKARETLRLANENLDFDLEGVKEIDAFIEGIGENRDLEIYEKICFAFSIFICKVLCDHCGGGILYKYESGSFDVVIGDIIVSPFSQVMIKFYDIENDPKNDLGHFIEKVYNFSITSASEKLVIDYAIYVTNEEKRLTLLN